MPTTVRNTDILFNDSTTQSTAAPAGGISHQAFTSSGTFTIPTGVTAVKVTVVGGGGGGGGASGGGCGSGFGGGGAAGSTAFKWLTSLTPGNTIGVTVGAGGTAGGTGGTGGSSSIQSGTQSITTVTALGGNGGAAGSPGGDVLGGLGQTPTNGDINITGDDGSSGLSTFYQLGIGGLNAAFSSRNRQTTNAVGVAGNVYGNGGNGAHSASVTLAGGAGAAGIVVFEW